MFTRTIVCAIAAPLAGLVASSPAHAAATWDRSAEAISILTKPGDPAGMYRITGAFKVAADDVSLLNLGTKVTILKNGNVLDSQVFDVQANAGALGDCVACPSPNSCVCAEPNGPCSCTALWLTVSLPAATPLAAGDVITLQVANASGAVADTNMANNTISRSFGGSISFWNRRLHSAEISPASCPGTTDLYDLSFFASVDLKGMIGQVPFEGVLTLVLDGATLAEFDFCNDNPWITLENSSCSSGSCGGESNDCGSGSCAGSNVQLSCMMVEIYDGAIMTCSCSSDPLCFKIPGIAIPGLTPSSNLKLVFSGNRATSLPEIPLLDGDNSVLVAQVAPPTPCPGDINGDGEVNGADLAEVLGSWGPCRE